MKLHFAFPDRALHFDCARCTALCCRSGQGFAAHAERELVPLLRHEPRLSAWVTSRKGNMVFFASAAGACCFLDAASRCSIERDLGRERKPSACRAFPFNRVMSLGEALVVLPHFMCPLELRSPGAEGVAGEHARLVLELEASGWLDQLFDPMALDASETPAAFLKAESELRELCTQALANGGSLGEVLTALGVDDSEAIDHAAELLCLPPLPPDPELERHFLALAPIWSAELSRWPRRTRLRAQSLARRLLGDALALRERRLNLQVCYALFGQRLALIELLTQLDEAMPSGLLPDSGHGDTMLAAALIDQAARRGCTVLEALRYGCAGLSALDRLIAIESVAQLLRARRQQTVHALACK